MPMEPPEGHCVHQESVCVCAKTLHKWSLQPFSSGVQYINTPNVHTQPAADALELENKIYCFPSKAQSVRRSVRMA